MSSEVLTDFPKIHCPFIRKIYKIDRDKWKKYGNYLKLRVPEVYLVTEDINPGYEWVFDDPDTIAVEKLDGTNVKLLTKNGRLEVLQNRSNIIDPLQIIKGGKTYIIDAIFRSIGKGYILPDGEQVGEVIGPKIQNNPYNLTYHEWYPFNKALGQLKYKSFHNYERTFDNWSSWFKDYLFSLLCVRRSLNDGPGKIMAEGVIFYNLKRKAEGKVYRAKLRRDMFEWFYSDKIDIYKNLLDNF